MAHILSSLCDGKIRVLAPDLRAHGDTAAGAETRYVELELELELERETETETDKSSA